MVCKVHPRKGRGYAEDVRERLPFGDARTRAGGDRFDRRSPLKSMDERTKTLQPVIKASVTSQRGSTVHTDELPGAGHRRLGIKQRYGSVIRSVTCV